MTPRIRIPRRRVASLAAGLVLAGTASACRPAEPLPPRTVSLAAVAPPPVAWTEARALDFGTPGLEGVREALWSGWGPDEKSARETFVWGGGERSRLALQVAEPRELRLVLRGWSFPFPDREGQRLRFVLNGDEFAERRLGGAAEEVDLRLPERALRRGENLLEIVYARHDETPGASPWAAAWDGVRLEGAKAIAAPRYDAPDGIVELDAGSALEWELALPPGAFLAWNAASSESGARLHLALGRGERTAVERIRGGAGAFRLTADDASAPATVHLSLTATGDRGRVRLEGLTLRLPEPTAASDRPTASALAGPETVAAGAADGTVPPNLIVYLIDTLRADHLGCYGYERPTSPRIDAFAREALLFRDGRAQAPWTRPAVATVLTGLPPWSHGVEERNSILPGTVETVAERLRDAGYETALFTTNANIVARFGFDQGWDEFHALFDRGRGGARRHVSSRRIHRAVVDWLERRAARVTDPTHPAKPFFLFVHTLDPHDPYRPPEEYRKIFAPDVDVESACCASSDALARLTKEAPDEARARAAAASALYDAEIAENDASFGMLLDELARRGLAESTAVLLTADHGEEFLDHGGWKHGFTVYDEMLRVPMILRLPVGAGGDRGAREVEATAEQIDIAPTLYALAGLPAGDGDPLPGRSLLDVASASAAGERFRLTSLARLVRAGLLTETARRGDLKVIARHGEWTPPLGAPPFELYDLVADRSERTDLALAERDERRALAAALARAIAAGSSPGEKAKTAIDPELDAALKALGYI